MLLTIRVSLTVTLLALSSQYICDAASPQPLTGSEPVSLLTPDRPVDAELSGTQIHRYKVALLAGQFCRVTVACGQADAILSIYSPKAERLIEMGASGLFDTQDTSIAAGLPGDYIIEIRRKI